MHFKDNFTILLDAKQIILAEVGAFDLTPFRAKAHECRSSTTDQLLEVFEISELICQNQHKEVTFLAVNATQQKP